MRLDFKKLFKKKDKSEAEEEKVTESETESNAGTVEESATETEDKETEVKESEDEEAETEESEDEEAEVKTEKPKKKKAKKKARKKIKIKRVDLVIKDGWHKFWYGTKDKPHHPFCWRSIIVRWFLKTFMGYVDYITTSYDPDIDEIRFDKVIIKRRDLPRESVHVTKMKKTYHMDLDLPKRGFDARLDNGFTASSAFNYMKNNAMSDAMVHDTDTYKPEIDKNKVFLICGIAFGIFMALYLVVIPMYT